MLMIDISCPFEEGRICLRQGCEACEVKLEAIMHVREAKVLDERIRVNGKIATLTRARKQFTCLHCSEVIYPHSYYYHVVYGHAGVSALKHPERVCVGCVMEFLNGGRK